MENICQRLWHGPKTSGTVDSVKRVTSNKSAQLTHLASRHHQKPLSDFITAANGLHKADDQLTIGNQIVQQNKTCV